MKFYIFKRLVQAVVTVFFIITIVFFVSRLGVNDPVLLMAAPDATKEDIQVIRQAFGLDKPVTIQYFCYLKELTKLNFGYSFFWNRPVLGLMLERIRATLLLSLTGLVVGFITHFPLGVLAAIYRNHRIDKAIRVWVFFGQSMPGFWLALLCIMFFSVYLGWLPMSGYGGIKHLIMPGVVLSIFGGAGVVRLLRSEMISVLTAEYIKLARAKGLAERVVLYKHALKVAILPLVTMMG
jgi:peptide/nickel transport system permease protein